MIPNNQLQYLLPLSKKINISLPKKFRKAIQLHNPCSNGFHFSFDELIKFLLKIPRNEKLNCKKSKTHDQNLESINFSIICDDCKLKLFRITIFPSQKHSIINTVSICIHNNIDFVLDGFASFCFLTNEINIETINADTFRSKHPFKIIGKFIFNMKNIDIILKKFLEPLVFSRKSIYLHSLVSSNSFSLESIVQNTKGYFCVGLYNSKVNINNLLIYEGKNVQYLIWIAPWISALLKITGYIQIDASFYALHPYVYSVPLFIYDNAAIPLGIVLGPSESSHLFDVFYKFVKTIFPTANLQKFSILSDEGSAIKLFAKIHNIKQFFCYRHLLEKIGSNSVIGEIARLLLFQPTKELYNNILPQAISDINAYLEESIVSKAQVEKFRNIFDLYYFGNHLISTSDHQHGLWNRMEDGVSTCSNHIERLHRTLNESVSGIHLIHRKLHIALSKLFDYFYNFEDKSRNQVYKLLNKFKKHEKKHNISVTNQIPCKCGWDSIYSHRFGIPSFPCIHTISTFNGEFKKLSLPDPIDLEINQIIKSNEINTWKFKSSLNETQSKHQSSPIEEEYNSSENLNDEFMFLKQTAREIIAQNNTELSFKEVLVKVSKYWGMVAPKKGIMTTDELISFRSEFKCDLLKLSQTFGFDELDAILQV